MNANDPEASIKAAYVDAKARGLPDCWTCSIDVSIVCRALVFSSMSLSTVIFDATESTILILPLTCFWILLFVLVLSFFSETQPPQMDRANR